MTNANKVKVSKEVAEAIEFLQNDYGYGFTEFMQVRAHGRFCSIRPAFPLNDVPVERLAEALINGYEVEQTPDEIVAELFKDISTEPSRYDAGYCAGILFVLEAYGLKIEGVNA